MFRSKSFFSTLIVFFASHVALSQVHHPLHPSSHSDNQQAQFLITQPANYFAASSAEFIPTMKIGILSQFWAQATQEQTTAAQDANPSFTRHWNRGLLLRRLRVLVGGTLSPQTSYFFESDAVSIGGVEPDGKKNIKISMFVQDAQIQHVFRSELSIIAGLHLVGITRNGLQSAASLMSLNYGSYQFYAAERLDNVAGRDIGLSLRGFLFDERLEYRTGVYSGKNFNQYSPYRMTTRLNYNFRDREKGFFYTGTLLGKGEILSVGSGIDLQGSYRAVAVDGFVELPLGADGSATASVAYSNLDGGGTDLKVTPMTKIIPRQSIFFFEAGYYFKEWKLQPYLKYESQSVDAAVLAQVGAASSTLQSRNKLLSGDRLGIGFNYFLAGHGASLKALYELVNRHRAALDPSSVESANHSEFTLQIQYYSF